ncbi:MAG: caspase family protein [Acidobacteria bacterium]|nr:caspase family protein [Acidobacteriota bacterium]
MKNLCGALLALSILFAAPAHPAQQAGGGTGTERRVALIIGNSAYGTNPLKNPVNDARAIARTVGELGFEVMQHENLSQNEMKRAIRVFGEKLRAGAVGLFYYAGHGMQVKGENYLIPVGASINGEAEVEYEAVSLGFVLAQMEDAQNRMNIVILDACRDNPFARSSRSGSRGLALVDAPGEMLVAYATGPGAVADDGDGANGVYTQELLKNLRTPGLSVEEVFKRVRMGVLKATSGRQKPWETSSLVSDFQFTGMRRVPPAVGSQPPQTTTSSTQQTPGTTDKAPNLKPIQRARLVDALRINGLTTEELVMQIKLRGVDFQVTADVERELQQAGARPEVIAAARANYRKP